MAEGSCGPTSTITAALRSSVAGMRPAASHAASTFSNNGKSPSTLFPVLLNQVFQPSAW